MKITALETVQLPQFGNILWLRVHTDEGLVGLGETFRGADAVARLPAHGGGAAPHRPGPAPRSTASRSC